MDKDIFRPVITWKQYIEGMINIDDDDFEGVC